ncbi:MAG: hypothetical protein AAF127_08100 [Pseudomonadota bacterium]
MWPFKSRKKRADAAAAEIPRAIEIASMKWLEFQSQEFAHDWSLFEKVAHFVEGMKAEFGQWSAFKGAPESIFLLIAVKGIERSRTHLRVELEGILGMPVPEPFERTDEEELEALKSVLIDRCARKWKFFEDSLKFEPSVTLAEKITLFREPFVEGLRRDFVMFKDARDQDFDPIIMFGIEKSGKSSLIEVERALHGGI